MRAGWYKGRAETLEEHNTRIGGKDSGELLPTAVWQVHKRAALRAVLDVLQSRAQWVAECATGCKLTPPDARQGGRDL